MTSYLLDTNIILRFANTHSSEYEIVNNAIVQILLQGGQCFITSQVLIEFWVVATRPIAVNGLGWTPEETEQAVQMLVSQFELHRRNAGYISHLVEPCHNSQDFR